MIREGRVAVAGRPATVGMQVAPQGAMVTVDGRPVTLRPALRYLALHKPAGYLSSCSDSRGRKTVLDLVPSAARLFPIGRLDLDSRGLLLLTNDGELCQHLTHPRFGVAKEYRLRVRGRPAPATLEAALRGIVDQGEALRCDHVFVERRDADSTELRVTLREGRRRELRRLWRRLGHPVLELCRVRVGPVSLGRLAEGTYRELRPAEVAALRTPGRA